MTDLSKFLLARIAEDEAANDELVRAEVARCRADGMPSLTEDEVRAYWSGQPWWERRLAECEAKRQFVEAIRYLAQLPDGMSMPDVESGMRLDSAARAMAAVYADHPDYELEWKP